MLQPDRPGSEVADYTIPAVGLPDGSYVMESKCIALALEPFFPEPCAYLDSPVLKQVEAARAATFTALIPVLVPRMPVECWAGPTIAFGIEARTKTFGMPLHELEARFGGEPAWQKAMSGLQRLADILNYDLSGPFCLGATPSYADFLIVAFLEWCRCAGGGCFERIVGFDKAFLELYIACDPWLRRNDY